MKLKTGDEVKILLGKDRGKNGKITRALVKENKVIVEGLNVYHRHLKRTPQREGGVIDISKPFNISNVGLICKSCKKVTRVGFKVEGNKKVRICRKCQEVLT